MFQDARIKQGKRNKRTFQYIIVPLIIELPLEQIETNEYNSRIDYSPESIARMARSLAANGQLAVLKVRPKSLDGKKFQLVYGHRRYLAAQKLGWKTIKAEVCEIPEEKMLIESLVENIEREEISDYEKALVFQKMSTGLHLTYEQIGSIAGISKQFVSSYIGMLKLFEKDELVKKPYLVDALNKVTERHARVISRVSDRESREQLILMAVREHSSVKELSNIVSHLRSWFPPKEENTGEELLNDHPTSKLESEGENTQREIYELTEEEFKSVERGDFASFRKMHLFGRGYSVFTTFSGSQCLKGEQAATEVGHWFHSRSQRSPWVIRDHSVKIIGPVAISTLTVCYPKIRGSKEMVRTVARGTIVYEKKGNSWKVVHEHWSATEGERETDLRNSSALVSSA